MDDPTLVLANGIKKNSWWQHRNGNNYRVITVTNRHADERDRYPVTIVYVDEDGREWSKPVERFLAGMTLRGVVIKHRSWTMPELRRVKARVEAGERWATVAADFNVHESTVRKQVYTHLGKMDFSARPRTFTREAMLLKAISLRNDEGLSYGIIVDRVGWPHTVVALRQAMRRYAEHHGMKLLKGKPRVRRCRWGNGE